MKTFVNKDINDDIIQEWNRLSGLENNRPFVYVNEDFEWFPDDEISDKDIDDNIVLIGIDANNEESKRSKHDRLIKHYIKNDEDDYEFDDEIPNTKASITFIDLMPEEEI